MNVELMTEQANQRVNFSGRDSHTRLPIYGLVGMGIITLAEILLFSRFPPVEMYFTPIVWTGYILILDALNFKLHGSSLIRTRPREFAFMLPWSIFCWLVFEGYNLYLQNWTYVGLPENIVLRWIGYGWSFATIFPAILETYEFVRPSFSTMRVRPREPSNRLLLSLLIAGLFCLLLPLAVNQNAASRMFALVWVGFAFLLEPITFWNGERSLIRDFRQGGIASLIALLLSGFICGILWEFWNYWASAKWHYSFPLSISGPKIFEMPLLGYLGFPAFAIEVYCLQNFLMMILTQKRLVLSSP